MGMSHVNRTRPDLIETLGSVQENDLLGFPDTRRRRRLPVDPPGTSLRDIVEPRSAAGSVRGTPKCGPAHRRRRGAVWRRGYPQAVADAPGPTPTFDEALSLACALLS